MIGMKARQRRARLQELRAARRYAAMVDAGAIALDQFLTRVAKRSEHHRHQVQMALEEVDTKCQRMVRERTAMLDGEVDKLRARLAELERELRAKQPRTTITDDLEILDLRVRP